VKVQVEIVDDEGIRTSFQREGDSFSTAFRPSTIKSVVNFLEDQIPKPAAIGPFDIESEDLTIKERLSYFLRYDERANYDRFGHAGVDFGPGGFDWSQFTRYGDVEDIFGDLFRDIFGGRGGSMGSSIFNEVFGGGYR